MSMPAACAANTLATARYSVEPARLNEYPVGSTNAMMRLGSPNSSRRSIASGSAASPDAVENAISDGSLTALQNARTGIRAKIAIGR